MGDNRYKILFFVSLFIYISFLIYNSISQTKWIFDSLFAIAMISWIYIKRDYFFMGKIEYTFFNLGIILHCLGVFGVYTFNSGQLGYDIFVHFVNCFIGGYLIYNFLSKRYLSKYKRNYITYLLSVSLIVLIGLFTEFIEFSGFLFYGSTGTNVGLLNVGPGVASGEYVDTMKDIFVNFISGVMGVMYYAFFKKNN